MKPMSITCRNARGFALPAAIFILVVLGALGAFAASLSSMQQTGTALDVQGMRTYQAARAGLEWGIYQSVKGLSACSATGGEVALNATTLQAFTVTVRCQPLTVDEGGVTLFAITAWACNSPAASSPKCPGITAVDGYVERKLSAVVEK